MLSFRIKPRPALSRCAGFFAALALLESGGVASLAQEAESGARGEPAQAKPGRTREFAPGVEIDWSEPAVRLAARVVLREGPLELFACSPQTKEHESILVVSARPLQIFQAMGLIGLESGSPPRYEEASGKWNLASGEPLDLVVEWREEDQTRRARPEAWMFEKATGRPPRELGWVFSGSTIRRDSASQLSREAGRDAGRFAADSDGTVACVVDFDSALISLSTLHSADDAELWLSANPAAIPPIGTRCTLTIRSAFHPKIEVELNKEGVIHYGEEELSAAEVGERLSGGGDRRNPRLVVTVVVEERNDKVRSSIEAIRSELQTRGLDPDSIMKVRTKVTRPSDP